MTTVNSFQIILDDLMRKPNKIWVPFKKWLKYYDIEMYSTYNEGK